MVKRTTLRTDRANKKVKAEPTFGGATKLARFIHENWRMRNNRVSPAAFYLNHDEKFLSVNSLEVEAMAQIKQQYVRRGAGSAAAVIKKVNHYNLAAREGGLQVSLVSGRWEYVGGGTSHRAYAHHYTDTSPSHSGVHFVFHIPNEKLTAYASKLVKERFHIL